MPDYSGRLTDLEFLAYNTVFASVERDFKELSAASEALIEAEHSIPRLLERPSGEYHETISANDRSQWQVISPILRLHGSQWILCKRQVGQESEFSVVERFDPDSKLAKSQGPLEVQMTSNDASLLLQDFIQGQQQMLHLLTNDILALAQEKMHREFSGQDMTRVITAISQRCFKTISTEQFVIPIQIRKPNEGVRV